MGEPKRRRKVTKDHRRRAARSWNPVVGGDRQSEHLDWPWVFVIPEPPVRGDGKP